MFIKTGEEVVYKIKLILGPETTDSEIWEHARRLKDLVQQEYPSATMEGVLYRMPVGYAGE